MEKTYVAIAFIGEYEDKSFAVVYAGTDYEKAKSNGIAFSITPEGKRNGNVNYVELEHWVDGKKIKDENIVS